MHIQWKGKGILVLVYAIVPVFSLFVLTKVIEENLFDKKFPDSVYQIVVGTSLIISGVWNWKTSDDFYIDRNGIKQSMNFDNRFMWIKMKFWSYVFWILSGLVFVNLLENQFKY